MKVSSQKCKCKVVKKWGKWILDMDGFFGGQFQIFQVEFLKHVSFRSDAKHDPEATTFRFYNPQKYQPSLVDWGFYVEPIEVPFTAG